MSKSWHLSRREVLRGTGAVIGLPYLEAMLPACQAAATGSTPPVRLVYHWVGTATNMDAWFPQDDGPGYTLSRALKPLERHRAQFSCITGTRNFPELDYGSGGEFGHNSALTWLTGHRIKTGSGPADLKTHSSVDQIAAKYLGADTRFPSLQLGIYKPGFHILSWSEHGTPLPTINSPGQLFRHLFSARSPADVAAFRANAARNRSILDLVAASRADMARRLGRQDQDKLDQYLTSLRELEAEIARDERWMAVPPPRTAAKPPPATAEQSKEAWLPAMYKLIALAFEADLTRVVTIAGDGPGESYEFIPGVIEHWHPISHHNRNPDKLEQMAKINEWTSRQLAGFLDQLHQVKEPNGRSLLDQSLILVGDSMTDGQHWGGNYPLLLAGHGGTKLRHGQHLRFCPSPRYGQDRWPLARVPTSNLYLAMLQLAGVPIEKLPASTGPLEGLV
jgi:hypothetical protein